MQKRNFVLWIAACVLFSLACRAVGGTSTPDTSLSAVTISAPAATSTPTATSAPAATSTPAEQPPPTPIPIPAGADLGYRQWAISATASSQYGDSGYGALQATGRPDTPACGDFISAWAPFDASGVEWLELMYDVPTVLTLIHIIQTGHPSQVVKVELIDLLDGYHEVYTAQPYAFDTCPYTLSIPVVDVDYQIGGLRITVDHTVLGVGRSGIDAVEVVGSVERPIIPEPAAGVLWRVGSTSDASPDLSFTIFGGIDATETAVYVADAYNGTYVFDLDGAYQGQLAQGEIGYVADVKVSPSGAVYMADLGFRQVVMFNAEGDLLGAFGGYGTGDGEFSGDSPAALAIGLDGSVYALDIGTDGARVQVFTAEGDFLRSFSIEEALGVKAMDVGPDGMLFLIGYGGYILELTPDDGRAIQRLGGDALREAFPQMFSVDDAGNFYVTTWSPPGAIKLDAQGRLLETFGIEAVGDSETGWPEGEFMFPVGIAVTDVGGQHYVFIGDGIGDFAFVTAFRYP